MGRMRFICRPPETKRWDFNAYLFWTHTHCLRNGDRQFAFPQLLVLQENWELG